MKKLHEHYHQRSLHIIGLCICLLGLMAVAFSAILHEIPLAINHHIFPFLYITQANLDALHVNYQYYLIACMALSGLFVDIVGPRTVLVVGVTVSLIANYFFFQTFSSSMSLFCSFIINISHIFIIIAALTLGTHWLPRRHFSLFVGFLTGILILTPIIAQPLLQMISSLQTMQKQLWAINALGILVFLGLLLMGHFADKTRHRHALRDMLHPLTQYKVWLLGLVAMLGWISNAMELSFGTILIIKRFDLNPNNALDIIKTASIYFAIGAICMGILSDILKSRRYLLAIGYSLAAASFSALILFPSIPFSMALGVLYLSVFLTSSIIICYKKANDYCTIGSSGITMGFILSISVIGNILLLRLMTDVLKVYANDAPLSDIFSWNTVPLIVPMLLLLGATITTILLRPPHPRPTIFLPINKQ